MPQYPYESERLTTGNALSSFPDTFALPGAVHDEVRHMQTAGSAQRPSSNMLDRAMYQRPPGVPEYGGGGYPDQSKERLRQMVRESLNLHMVSQDTLLSAHDSSGGI